MLRSSIVLIFLALTGCTHKNGDFFLAAPQTSDAGLGTEKPLYKEVEIQADIPMVDRAVECRPAMRDAETQTEYEQLNMLNISNIDDVKNIEQEQNPVQFNIDDVSEVESEYFDDEENESIFFGESILMGSDHSQQQEPVETPKQNRTPEISNIPPFSEENNSEHHSDSSWEILE